MKNIEIELKYRLNSDVAVLREKLASLGHVETRSRQKDTYYNAPHRDFLAGKPAVSEWLRVREEENTASINFKRWHPLDAVDKTHCDEYESQIGDPEAVTLLLKSLDCKELGVVDKHREEWVTTDRAIAVAIDEVTNLGTFVEFEFKGEADSIEAATGVLHEFVKNLGVEVGDRIKGGYPHMVLGLLEA